jgi:MFS family permease
MTRVSAKSSAQRMLAVLMVIMAFNFVDRLALGLMLQNIKHDLSLTDTQLGLLTGIAFALFYSIMGIPIARWADCGNRVVIIVTTTALWSAAVALCGVAGNFLQLVLIRVGVAVGEAGCVPPAHSLIADYFDGTERPRAFAIYMLGIPLAMIIGYFLGGWLNEAYGWRITFFVLGAPGLALAALARFVLKEPRLDKKWVTTAAGPPKIRLPDARPLTASSPKLFEVVSALWANRTFCHLLLCIAISSFFGYGLLQWEPAFFIRSYGVGTGEVGTWFALIYGVGGLVGTYLGGELASRYAAHNVVRQLKWMALGYSSFGIFSAAIYLSPNRYWALAFLSLATLGGFTVNGPVFAAIQTLVPERMRATSIALVYLFSNLIGLGLGPLAAGVLSDAFRPWAGEDSLRYALLLLSPGYVWVGWHAWLGARHLAGEQKCAPTIVTSRT